MYTLPSVINTDGGSLHIREQGDFRVILDCFLALQDEDLPNEFRIASALIIFYEEFNDIEDIQNYPYIEQAVQEMFNFFRCNEPESRDTKNYRLIDWDKDSQLIASAINKVAGKEIRIEPFIHWWTFMGYYTAIGESSLSTIISIRKKIAEHKKLEKYEQEFRRDNPQYFTWDFRGVEQKEADNLLKELWNNK